MIVSISESNPKIQCQYVLLKAKFFFNFFFKKTKKKENYKKETKQIENKIRKGGNLPTPPHFIHALSSMYSICI